jgi:hypothetical protein
MLVVAVCHSTNNDRSNGPKHLQHLRCRGSKLNRYNLTAVGGSVGNEDSPGQAFQKLGDEHDRQRVGEVHGEDENVQEHETGQGGPAVSNAAGQRTSDENADKCSQLSRDLQCRLPLCLNEHLACRRIDHTEILCKRRQGDEVANKEHVVGLHDLKELAKSIRRV